ncbi:MAG: DUF4416 family protein [Thermoguttaceae bacterium]|nr:DUF4416 family protein [Thermoguttaceae bacterium]MDW8037124.1 DUF4416 family protein [Thermoguttaceae bacterium]
MGQPMPHPPVLVLMAAFSRYEEAIEWARQRSAAQWGPPALESRLFDFHETNYYQPTMGGPLKKQFFVFSQLQDPARLVDWKLQTNAWELEYAQLGRHPEPRPLNLDPGYLTLAKLVLASTKDFTHRIYLDRGIYAEITLFYRHGRWEAHPWTFPDYRRPDYQEFFSQARQYLQHRLQQSRGSE